MENAYLFGLGFAAALALQLLVEALVERPLKRKLKELEGYVEGHSKWLVSVDHVTDGLNVRLGRIESRQPDTHGDGLKKTEVHGPGGSAVLKNLEYIEHERKSNGGKGTTKKRRPNKRNA